ncbi:unnamed protein product [Parnassius mnemosyne]|uniref:Uncharacterized protein n=1 Tax=Parnassius mnemosyne TaxID=213953 RepID=A0AAV1M174_9NEOP
MNKEIVKLQNYFNNLNLRNNINIKSTIKKIENIKCKDWKQILKQDSEEINNEFVSYLANNENSQCSAMDNNFKLQIKPFKQSNAYNDKKIYNRNELDTVVRSDEDLDFTNAVDKQNCENCEQITTATNNYFNNDLDINYNIKENKNGVDDKKSNSVNEINEFRTDLESLLILMAINSKADNNEDHHKFEADNHYDNETIIKNECNEDYVHERVISKKENNDMSDLLCIIPIRTNTQKRFNYICKKYVKKWKDHVENKKQIRQREAAITNFFDKLAKKKSNIIQSPESINKTKLYVRDYNTYQHRYKVQQNIIALQKMKLEEQTKIIEQLKYNKIIESSKQSLDAMREEVCKTYYQMDRQLKPKIKCLTNELKIREIEEPSLVLQCLKVPQFIQRMEKRAREREEKHAMIRERRRQMEEERIRLKQQSELAKADMDKEEKQKRMKELREKRKREKIENIRKKQHAERMRALAVLADLHYEKKIMAKYGINPLRRLLNIKRDNMEKARSHYLFQLKKNVFLHWMWHTEDMWFERNYKAEEFSRKKILSRTFDCLKKNHHEFKLKVQVAEDYYDLYITQLVFRKFREGIELVKKEFKIKMYNAVLYHNSNLLFKTFTCWRTLPALNALKREQEVRKLRWREKVLQVVPDYKPPDE